MAAVDWERYVVGIESAFSCNPEYLGYCTADISYNLTVGVPISRRPVVALISTTYKPDL